ncbi:succinylglutamate desuccinylase/aspartoacylase family protein [Maribacter sp. 2307ULW6-5]|uniref:succinylglutamate desuccinylase/aspartoacylase domain-containing protein n=1 Tax=Maribacter sp. 2307ULW6-5 TaxID=3386275 RepID=UPI0039BD578B
MQRTATLTVAPDLVSERIVGHVRSSRQGPTIVFFGGIHGNEPAGLEALKRVFGKLKGSKSHIKGSIYAVAGNLGALLQGVRFQEEDLNRIWLPQRLEKTAHGHAPSSPDEKEMRALHQLIHQITESDRPPYYFMDLHTTSGHTDPFIVVNDSLLNRKFTSHYPLPIVLGIEEYLAGALLSYINELGYVSFGFEAGQHADPRAVTVAEHFIWYSMALAGGLELAPQTLQMHYSALALGKFPKATFMEIYHQFTIGKGDHFKMAPGFENFQKIPKGRTLATLNGEPLITQEERKIFMPLYQEKGAEGFYFVKRTPLFFLILSKYIRKIKAERLLLWLPGVSRSRETPSALLVDKRTARFMAISFFHLLGYRVRRRGAHHLELQGRDRTSRDRAYQDAPWY